MEKQMIKKIKSFEKLTRTELIVSVKENVLIMNQFLLDPNNIGEEEYALEQFIKILTELLFKLEEKEE